MKLPHLAAMSLALVLFVLAQGKGGDKADGVSVDKNTKTIVIPCKVAPRKLPNLKMVYPLEVVATWPAPKGQKAHETVIVFEAKPSAVHKALESLGLKPGKPALGEMGTASGPQVKIFLEIPQGDAPAKRLPIEQTMVDTKTKQTLPEQKWHFTGSAFKNPDPEKDDKVYGADVTGTLITIFPVTNDTVFQSALSKKDEGKWRLETNTQILPKEGSEVKLIIQATGGK